MIALTRLLNRVGILTGFNDSQTYVRFPRTAGIFTAVDLRGFVPNNIIIICFVGQDSLILVKIIRDTYNENVP